MRDLDSRAFELAAPAWPLPATPDCGAVGADGLVVEGTPNGVLMEVSGFSEETDCLPELFCVELERVLCSLLELIRPMAGELENDGVRVLIDPPIREVKSELIRPLEFVFPAWRPVLRPELLRLELGDEDLPTLKELPTEERLVPVDGDEMIDEVGAREVIVGLVVMLLDELPELVMLREGPDRVGLDDIEVPGLIILLELVGGCMDREMLLLEGRLVRLELDRPMDGGLIRPTDGALVGARLMLGGALILGAGAGAGAGLETCRLAELPPPPEVELFRSTLSPKTGPQSRIKTDMSTRIPILTFLRYSIADMICLLSANGSTQRFYSNYKRP